MKKRKKIGNVEITKKGIYFQRKHYIAQKTRAQVAMWLLMLPIFVLGIYLILGLGSSILFIMIGTILLLLVVTFIGMNLGKIWISKQDAKDGINDTEVVEEKLVVNLPKGKHKYKFAFEEGNLIWYPFLNRTTHLVLNQEDIIGMEFGWGIIESWVRDKGLVWSKSDIFPHASNGAIGGPIVPLTREAEGGWINVYLGEKPMKSHWIDDPEEWIASNNATIIGGQPLLIMKGFDISFKDLKTISLALSERTSFTIRHVGKEIDWGK